MKKKNVWNNQKKIPDNIWKYLKKKKKKGLFGAIFFGFSIENDWC